MDKRKAKRSQNKASQTQRFAALQTDIMTAISAGKDYESLACDYSESILKRVFSRLAIEAPELLDRALGAPAHEMRILIDECVDPAVLPDIHRGVGRAIPAALLFGKSVKDQPLYQAATENRFHAIVSCDSVSAGKHDLCGLARRAFEGGNPHAPRIIIVPQKTEDALAALRQHVQMMSDFLHKKEAPPVLTLNAGM